MGTAFVVEGGYRLSGEIVPQGAKNEALQVLCGSLLTDRPVVIRRVPRIRDVEYLLEAMKALGVEVSYLARDVVRVHAREVHWEGMRTDAFRRAIRRIRGGVMLVGPVLVRTGCAVLPQPGGDRIGRRRLDTHLEGLRQLGVDVEYRSGEREYWFRVGRWASGGVRVWFWEPSVTGTANVLMAATACSFPVELYHCACEPYVQQLCRFLRRLGYRIEGVGTNRLRLVGYDPPSGSDPFSHDLQPDMIEIGSFIGLAAMTQSDIRIRDAMPDQIPNILRVFARLGIDFRIEGDTIHVPAQEVYEVQPFADGSILTVYDAPWPGFPADLLSVVLVTAVQARGTVLIHQKMFESRLFFVDSLIDMGAQIILCDPHRATVVGLARRVALRPVEMSSPDIRAGIAMLIAALSASGTSIIRNAHQIDRGYEAIDVRLRRLGARIERIEE